MTDTVIGVVGTLVGTALGFGFTWAKELFDEKRELVVEFRQLNLTVEKQLTMTQVKYDIQVVLHNNANRRQPLYDMILFFSGNTKHSLRSMSFHPQIMKVKNYAAASKAQDGLYEEFDSFHVDPKSINVLNFEWYERYSGDLTKYFRDAKTYVTFGTAKGIVKRNISYHVYIKE